MRENGTDRDVAISILNVVNDIVEVVSTINSNLYSPHILTQPTDAVTALGETATFTIVAVNVKSYQWQYYDQYATPPVWVDATQTGADQAVYSLVATESRYNTLRRCKITGLDDSVIYTDEVAILAPET